MFASVVCLFVPLMLWAQTGSITITPANESVGTGLTKQYTANVTGLMTTGVTWSVNGEPGGDPTIGTISSTGLYTAPTSVPASNPVTIQATSTADMTVSGSTSLTIRQAGPTLTSVSPASLPVGSFTITVNGSGFMNGAIVYNGVMQFQTAYISPTQVKATGTVSTAGNAFIRVSNPGTMFSNIITIQFTSGSSGTPSNPPPPPPVSNQPASITSVTPSTIPTGVFTIAITGSGFVNTTQASLGGTPLAVTYVSPTTLTAAGYSVQTGSSNVTVTNGTFTSTPFAVQLGVNNPQVSVAAARRFLEQAAFGPSPADAMHVQQVGFQGWLNEQFAMAKISNYQNLPGNQGGMAPRFMTNSVMNADQLRQRVAFALSQIFVVSINKLIWNNNVVPFEEMLMADAFSNYRQILNDVTLSPSMGFYLDMANNARANAAGTVLPNENYAREVLQLFSLGTTLLNPDGMKQFDANGNPIPTYDQKTVTEFARVFTGWTYAPAPGNPVVWGAYITMNGPMVPYPAMHDTGSKTLLNGKALPGGQSPQQDLSDALDNIFNHPNVGPFIGKQLIQHLVKSNPSPAYVTRVAAVFNDNGQGVRGDMRAVIQAVLLDPEARQNDTGGNDQIADGHLQEPALFLAGIFRALNAQMNDQNYFSNDLTAMGQDIYNAPSVFNYYSTSTMVPGVGLLGPEFQLDTPYTAVYRANFVSGFFNAYNNPIQTYGPGTTVDLTAFVALASNPSSLVDALDITFTHGTMPSSMKQTLVSAVQAESGGNVRRVQTGLYLLLSSGYYNVWH